MVDGLVVSKGGLTVAGTGLDISQDGLTVENTGINVAGGLSVIGSVSQATDLTVYNSGIVVVSGGLTLNHYGIKTAKLVVHKDGIKVTGGLTIYDGGLKVANGLELEKGEFNVFGGIEATGGLKSKAAGVQVFDGITVYSGGVVVSGGQLTLPHTHDTSAWNTANFAETPSDERLKADITIVERPLDILSKLNGVYFTWKDIDLFNDTLTSASPADGGSKRRSIGFIAQDVLKVLPDAITEIYNGKYYGVKYHSILPLIIEAVRELHTKASRIYRAQLVDRRKMALRDDIQTLKKYQENDRKLLESISRDRLPRVETLLSSVSNQPRFDMKTTVN